MRFGHRLLVSACCILVLLAAVGHARAGGGHVWTYVTPRPDPGKLLQLINHNGRFLGVGRSGTILSSADGSTWSQMASGTGQELRGIAYGNSRYVAAGANGAVVISTNGEHWKAYRVDQLGGYSPLALAYGNDIFVAVGFSHREGVLTHSLDGGITWELDEAAVTCEAKISADGLTWKAVQLPACAQRITYGNGLFVAMAERTIMTSPDGRNWTTRTIPQGGRLLTLLYGDGLFVAAGEEGTLISSGDGVAWTPHAVHKDVRLMTSAYHNGRFVIMGVGVEHFVVNGQKSTGWRGVKTVTSIGGQSWFISHARDIGVPLAVAGGNNGFLSVLQHQTTLRSTDGITWTETGSSELGFLAGVAFGKGLFVTASDRPDGGIYTSPDGLTWTRRYGRPDNWAFHVLFANERFLVLFGTERGARVVTSEDGITWQETATSSLTGTEAIAYGNGRYILVGWNGLVMWSEDGRAWQRGASGVTVDLWDVTWGNGQFVAVGESGTLITSPDGTSWTRVPLPVTDPIRSVTFGQGQFLATGVSNPTTTAHEPAEGGKSGLVRVEVVDESRGFVLTSPDGATWALQEKVPLGAVQVLDFHDGEYHAAGSFNWVATSADGKTWGTAPYGYQGFSFGSAPTGLAVGNGSLVVSTYEGILVSRSDMPAQPAPERIEVPSPPGVPAPPEDPPEPDHSTDSLIRRLRLPAPPGVGLFGAALDAGWTRLSEPALQMWPW